MAVLAVLWELVVRFWHRATYRFAQRISVLAGATFIALLPMLVSAEDAAVSAVSNPANIQQWEVILGFIQPFMLSFILQSGWSRKTQSFVAFTFTVAVTTVGMYLQGDFHGVTDWLTSVLTVFAVSIPSYYGFWKPTGISPAIEAKTSGAKTT